MRKNEKKAAEFDRPATIISKDTLLETARLVSESPVQLAGQFIGDLDIKSSLVIGETGKVKGNIKAQFILVAGEVIGNIQAEGSLHITSSGSVTGEIICESIIVDQDATLNSSSVMKYSEDHKKNAEVEKIERVEKSDELKEEIKEEIKEERKNERVVNDYKDDEDSDDAVFVKVF